MLISTQWIQFISISAVLLGVVLLGVLVKLLRPETKSAQEQQDKVDIPPAVVEQQDEKPVSAIEADVRARRAALALRMNEPLSNFGLDELDDRDEAQNSSGQKNDTAVGITYKAVTGRITKRSIEIVKLETRKNGLYVIAFCYKRKAIRSFKVDRIQTMFLPDTGEVIARPIDYLRRLSLS